MNLQLVSIGLMPVFPIDQVEITAVDEDSGTLAQYENWVSPVNGISEQNHATS